MRSASRRRARAGLLAAALLLAFAANGGAAEPGQAALDRALALRATGRADDARAALPLVDEALDRFRASGDQRGEALALSVRASAFYTLGQTEEGVAAYTAAVGLWQAAGAPLGEAEARNSLATGLIALGRAAEAQEQLERALALARASGDRKVEGAVLHNLGSLAASRSDLAAARGWYEQALATRRAAGDRAGQATSLGNLGRVYRLLGELQRALASYQEALSLRAAPADRLANRAILHNLAALRFQLGEPERAEALYREALGLARETGDRQGQAYMLHGLAGLLAETGRGAEAGPLFQEALALWRALGLRTGEAHTLAFLGTVEQRQGHCEAAQRRIVQALEIHRATGGRGGETEALLRLGQARHACGDLAGALEPLQAALPLARDTGQRGYEAEALFRLARAEKDRGELAAAREHVEAALALLEDLRFTLASPDLRASFRAARNEPYELYVEILLRLHAQEPGQGWDAAALEASERGRARSLFERLTAGGVELRRGAPPALLEREAGLRLEIRSLEAGRLAAPQMEAEIGRKLEDYRALESEILAASPAYADLARPAALRTGELRALLDPGTLLVEIALGEKSSHAWVLTRDSLQARELPARADLEAAARRLLERVTSPDRRTAARPAELAAAELSGQIFGPLADLLDRPSAARLVLVVDGALGSVPFGVLPFPPGQAAPEPLLARFEIVALPSLSVLPALRRGREALQAAGRPEVAVLADPVFGPDDPRLANRPVRRPDSGSAAARAGLERLAFSAREAEAILRLAPPGSGLAALGFRADRATVTGPEVARARIVHFATHAELDGRHPELSGIVLALWNEAGEPQDGFLRLQDLYALDLSADLVVLSACRTALGRELPGEGLIGLTRGFFHAGSPRVVATLWDVQDAATAELMARFYRGLLQEKLPAAAALRRAQLSLRGERLWSRPFFWGGFVLQGDWR